MILCFRNGLRTPHLCSHAANYGCLGMRPPVGSLVVRGDQTFLVKGKV
jgi:hypothetical protein